jgi:hypothetical protein
MPDPHPELTRAMFDAYNCARIEARYNAPRFLEMLHERYGHGTALHLIHSPDPSIGFTHLWERKRLDLTVEALVLRPEWQILFKAADLEAARARLQQYHYDFPINSWHPAEVEQAGTPRLPVSSDIESPPPDRVATTTYRIIRDTELARRVKSMHDFRCQICGHVILLPDGSRYAEAHHIRPLGEPHNGPDVLGNIICVCPNHHAELDYFVIRLDLPSLHHVNGHEIDAGFVDYHNFRHANK